MNYYYKYIKYKTKYIDLKSKTNNNTQINQIAGKINNYQINEKEVNIFGYTHSKIYGGCIF